MFSGFRTLPTMQTLVHADAVAVCLGIEIQETR